MADYGDFKQPLDRDEYIAKVKEIDALFKVSGDDIRKAEDAAGVTWTELLYTRYFLAKCIDSARDLLEETDWGDTEPDIDALHDEIPEYADGCVPHQTYVLWMIWVDCGYDSDALEELGMDFNAAELYRVPQYQLYTYAERIIYDHIQKTLD